MAHFAKLDENNKVLQVIVVLNSVITDENGDEQEQIGIDFLLNLYGGGRWKQTSYNNNFRKQFASIGYSYNESDDVFIKGQQFPSWTLDQNHDWQSPVLKPDGVHDWNEEAQSWDEIL